MGCIIDKIVLLILSFFLMMRYQEGILLVTCLFLIVAVTTMIEFLQDRDSKIEFALEIVMASLCLFVPGLFAMLPVNIYDSVRRKNIPAGIVMFIAFIETFVQNIGGRDVIYLAVICGVAVLLCLKTEKNNELEIRLKNIRDDSVEKENLLKEQNIRIIENQDKEVFVAKLKERNRIAREIHDNVGHMLSRSILQMGALLAIYKQEPLHGQLNEVRKTLDTAMNNIRESVHDLHDESIDTKQAILDILKPLECKYKVRLEYDAENDMSKEIKYAVIGIIKECVSNIIKHSNNDMVDVNINEHPSMYQIIVRDYSGKKTENKQAVISNTSNDIDIDGDGIGLINIKNRVEKLNGRLYINDNDGFKVFATIPK